MAYHSTHLTNPEIRDALRQEFTMEQIHRLTLASIKPASPRRRGIFRDGNRIRVLTSGFVVVLFEPKP